MLMADFGPSDLFPSRQLSTGHSRALLDLCSLSYGYSGERKATQMQHGQSRQATMRIRLQCGEKGERDGGGGVE